MLLANNKRVVKRVMHSAIAIFKGLVCLWSFVAIAPLHTGGAKKAKEEEAMIKEMYEKMSPNDRKEFDKLVNEYTEILSKPEKLDEFNSMLEDMNKAIDQMGGLD